MRIDLDEKIYEDLKYCISLFIVHLEERQEISKDFDIDLLDRAKDCELVLIEAFYKNLLPRRIVPREKNIMKRRYEIRDTSRGLGYFDSEEQVEDFFFNNSKMLYSPREVEAMWIVSSGKRGWWALSADNYLNRRGSYYIPAEVPPIESKPVSMPAQEGRPLDELH